ncbi:unnamed protein product [Amoebophrya sp. A25]|nr:unnamed protein product [Amoebophrya sp. A25]|eukprot:GSA25T00000762001.1
MAASRCASRRAVQLFVWQWSTTSVRSSGALPSPRAVPLGLPPSVTTERKTTSNEQNGGSIPSSTSGRTTEDDKTSSGRAGSSPRKSEVKASKRSQEPQIVAAHLRKNTRNEAGGGAPTSSSLETSGQKSLTSSSEIYDIGGRRSTMSRKISPPPRGPSGRRGIRKNDKAEVAESPPSLVVVEKMSFLAPAEGMRNPLSLQRKFVTSHGGGGARTKAARASNSTGVPDCDLYMHRGVGPIVDAPSCVDACKSEYYRGVCGVNSNWVVQATTWPETNECQCLKNGTLCANADPAVTWVWNQICFTSRVASLTSNTTGTGVGTGIASASAGTSTLLLFFLPLVLFVMCFFCLIYYVATVLLQGMFANMLKKPS